MFASARNDLQDMLRDIRMETELTRQLTGYARLDDRVLTAMERVPRHDFIPDTLRDQAYWNGPLPIGHGQTISQPFIVALMTQLLVPAPEHVVLEVGTGSGYQAAVLAELVARVHSLEIIDALGQLAATRLRALGYDNVTVHISDGYLGWPEQAPYDGIIVTAAAPHVPPALVEQLRPGGRLVIPVGRSGWSQTLKLLEKSATGEVRERNILDVAFVPLTGGHDEEPD
jgi:protein-L-isoaspartate(D-aspartate) O-methyltransferase